MTQRFLILTASRLAQEAEAERLESLGDLVEAGGVDALAATGDGFSGGGATDGAADSGGAFDDRSGVES